MKGKSLLKKNKFLATKKLTVRLLNDLLAVSHNSDNTLFCPSCFHRPKRHHEGCQLYQHLAFTTQQAAIFTLKQTLLNAKKQQRK